MGDETAGFLQLIWVRWKQEYFLGKDWTGQIALNRFNKIVDWRPVVGSELMRRTHDP